MHLMARGTENYEVADSVVTALAVDMADLQNIGDAKAAVSAHWWILRECQSPIIDAFHMGQWVCLLTKTISGAAPIPSE
jgi:hypothetical protein